MRQHAALTDILYGPNKAGDFSSFLFCIYFCFLFMWIVHLSMDVDKGHTWGGGTVFPHRNIWLTSGRVEYQLPWIYLFSVTHHLTLQCFEAFATPTWIPIKPPCKHHIVTVLFFLWIKSKDAKLLLIRLNWKRGTFNCVSHLKATKRHSASQQCSFLQSGTG